MKALIEDDDEEEDEDGEGCLAAGAVLPDDDDVDDGGRVQKKGEGRGTGARGGIGNPLRTLGLLFELPTGLILLANGLLFAGYYSVTSSVPSQLHEIYGVDDLQVGLIFIAPGMGTPMVSKNVFLLCFAGSGGHSEMSLLLFPLLPLFYPLFVAP